MNANGTAEEKEPLDIDSDCEWSDAEICDTDSYISEITDTDSENQFATSEDDDDEEDVDKDVVLQQNSWMPATRQPPLNEFVGKQGPTNAASVENEDSPMDYFDLIFSHRVIEVIVEETNKYATQCLAATPSSSDAEAWKSVDEKEMKVYLGLIMLTGIITKGGGLESYWTNDSMLQTPFFGKCMSEDRFQQISNFLHFSDNTKLPENAEEEMYEIRQVFDLIVKRWQDLYDLGEHITIEEAMIKRKIRLNLGVYTTDEPIECGVQSYILADSSSHYCWNTNIYHHVEETRQTKDTVTKLLTPKCYFLWHSLYMNSLFNSVGLSELLLDFKIHTIGTLRSKRGEPQEVRAPQLGPGDIIARDNGKVMVLAWKRGRTVKAISTKHSASFTTVTRRRSGGRIEEIKKPTCYVDYCNHTPEEFLLDDSIIYYPCKQRTLKWTQEVFFYLLEVSVHNSFILYKEKSTAKSFDAIEEFYLKLIKQLCNANTADVPPYKSRLGRLRGGIATHQFAMFQATENKEQPQKKCRVCLKHGNRMDTPYYCSYCGVPLCVSPCFKKYHTEADY